VDVFHNVLTMDRVYCKRGPNISNPVVVAVENRQLGVGQSFDIAVDGHNLTIRRERDTNGASTFRIQVNPHSG
jgi:hypothetical protein